MVRLYILKCDDNALYTGVTTDVERRFSEHATLVGAKYTRAHGASEILYREPCDTRSVACKREAEIKKMTREQKLALIGTTA